MKINKLALLLLPILTLTSCGGKTLTEEETKQAVASFVVNNDEAVNNVKGYTIKNETTISNTVTSESGTIKQTAKNVATVKFDIENFAYYVNQSTEITDDLAPNNNVSISFEEWLYFEEETSNFVYAVDGLINGEEIKNYVKIPSNKDLFNEVFDEYLNSDVEIIEPDEFAAEGTLEDILLFFEEANSNVNTELVVKSKGEGHLNVLYKNKASEETSTKKEEERITLLVEFNNYLLSKNEVKITSVEEDLILKTKAEEEISALVTLSPKCSYKYPNLDNFNSGF